MWVGLVPAMFALDLLAPSSDGLPLGVGEALGCGGSGNLPAVDGWTSLKPMLYPSSPGSASTDIPVATDGFFVIDAQSHNLDVETAAAQLRVVVRDDAGTEVPGDVSVLRTQAYPTFDSYLFGWVAREPLAVGVRLTATLATEPATVTGSTVGGEFALTVAGAPTAMSTPAATFDRWGSFYRGDGEVGGAECPAPPGSGRCDQTLPLPPRVIEELATQVVWTPPEVAGGVAWRVRLDLGEQPGEAGPAKEFFGRIEASEPGLYLPIVRFRELSGRHCVSVVVEDLRTGLEQRSELCSEPAPLAGSFGSNTYLQQCPEPPSAELTPAWCDMNPGSTLAACDGVREDGSQVGCTLSAERARAPALVSLAGIVLAHAMRRRRPRRGGR
jgi:hypothetical protein